MKTRNYLLLILLFGILLSGCQKDEEFTSQSAPDLKAGAGMLKIAFASDIHYMAPELLIQDGSAFQDYLNADPKLLKESKDILIQLISQLNDDKPDLLIIPGDMTKDGELISHQQFIDILETHLDYKIKVLVLPGNHDIANPDAMYFNGETTSPAPTVTEEEFVNLYEDFGYGDAISRDEHTLSYVAEPFKNFRVIFIDATIRPNPLDPGECPLGGVIPGETLDWIDTQMAAASTKHMQVIAVMHHKLVEHYDYQNLLQPGYVIFNSAEAVERLGDAGLKAVFTGHYHANDVTMCAERELYDIQTGSVVSWPLPYRLVRYYNNGRMEITTSYIRGINIGQVPLDLYAQSFLHSHLYGIFYYMAMGFGGTPALCNDAALLLAPAFMEQYNGDEVFTPEEQLQMAQFLASLGGNYETLATMFYLAYSNWNTDKSPQDNNITFNF